MMRRLAVLLAVVAALLATSASAADTPLTVVSQTATTITFSYPAAPGAAGYRYYADGQPVSRTFDPSRLTVRFSKSFSSYRVVPMDVSERPDGYVYPVAPPPPPPPSGANVWVDSNGGSCARSATPAAYQDASACGSFAAAYTAAQSGDVVGVTGSLGSQFFAGGANSSQGRGTKTLTFRGEVGNKVRQIHFGSPNLTFDGINVDASNAMLGGSDGALFENGGEPFVFKNGSIGNVRDQKGALVDGPGIVFDNVRFHDVVLATDGVHNECIFAAVPEGMVVRNSTFTNCAVMDIFFKYPDWWSPLPPPYGNVVLENNVFGQPVGTYALYITIIGTTFSNSAPVTGWTVRNNRIDGPVNIDAPIGSGNTFCGNTGAGVPSGWGSAC